jgi:hypothetical protein
LQTLHKEYLVKLDELNTIQGKCMKELTHQRYRLGIIKSSLKKFGKAKDCKETLEELEKGMSRRKIQLFEMERTGFT